MTKQDLTQYADNELTNVVINDESLHTSFENDDTTAEDYIENNLSDLFEYTDEQEEDFIETYNEEHAKRFISDKIDEEAKTDLEVEVGEWLKEQLESYEDLKGVLNDLLQNGCSSGMVSGLIYYNDTERFHDTHEDDIWNLADEQKDQLGHSTVLEMFASLNGADSVGSMGQFKNLLSWYAFEETARDLGHRLEIEI